MLYLAQLLPSIEFEYVFSVHAYMGIFFDSFMWYKGSILYRPTSFNFNSVSFLRIFVLGGIITSARKAKL